MLRIKIDKEAKIVCVEPEGELTKNDFVFATSKIDPFIEEYGELNGLIIHVKSFPGWESFGAMIKHFKFVKDHHRKIAKVALVTDSLLGGFAEHVANHFTSAEIKHFAFGEFESAQKWITENNK